MTGIDWRALCGQHIEGKYHLSEFIDAGSYGVVFRADELVGDRLMRSLAIKILNPVKGDTEYRRNVLREKQLTELMYAASLDHPHIIRCHSVGQWESPHGPLLYIVMELAELTLEDVISHGPLEPEQAADVLTQLATALEYLHGEGRGLVHRDIKPANILLVGGRWKLSDLGTAQALEGKRSVTVTAFGTAEYAPPESYDGMVTRGWDIWSLGVLLVECLSLELPFHGSNQRELMANVLHEKPQIPLRVREPFAGIARRCLARDHAARCSATEVLRDLVSFSDAGLSPAVPDYTDNPFALVDDNEALLLLEQRIRRALADQIISSMERAELNDLARELRVPLATARSLFNRVRGEMIPPDIDNAAAPATPRDLPKHEPAAAILTVGGAAGYPTISAAIQAARPGSRIEIMPGSYNEQLVIDRELDICGKGQPGQVRIVCRDQHTVLCKTARASLENLELICRVSNAGVHAAALCLPFGQCSVNRCRISSEGDACVTAFGRSSRPELVDCELKGGRTACLSISHHASVTLRNCRISQAMFAGIYVGSGSELVMQGGEISGIRGSGIMFHDDGEGLICRCSIRDCLEHGVLLSGTGSPRFEDCAINQNHTFGIAGGLEGQAVFTDCDIRLNARGACEQADAPLRLDSCRLD
jgi:serine/threonine-protein kinase